MYILVFETTGEYASVACIDENGCIFEEKSDGVLKHLQSLIPMTKSLLEKNNLGVSDVSCVAASSGPGSFTGIRIGVATARAFAQAMNIPCVSVPTLEAFVYNSAGFFGIACPVLDARRGQVYAGAFRLGGEDGEIRPAVEGGAYLLDEYLELLERSAVAHGAVSVRFFGDGAEKHREKITQFMQKQCISSNADIRYDFAEGAERLQTASSAARLALKLYRGGGKTDYKGLLPVYMRKAEAERKLEAGLL